MNKRSVRMILAMVALLLLLPLCFIIRPSFGDGRWPIAPEELEVNGVRSQKGRLSFFVPISIQATNSVVRVKPVHYLRPYQIEERVGGEWVPIPARRKYYWAQMSSASGLQQCLCRFVFPQVSGEYRALLVYRYRSRWDFFRRRMANRLPRKLSQWVLPRRADGAVWTEPFFVELDEKKNEASRVDGGQGSEEKVGPSEEFSSEN